MEAVGWSPDAAMERCLCGILILGNDCVHLWITKPRRLRKFQEWFIHAPLVHVFVTFALLLLLFETCSHSLVAPRDGCVLMCTDTTRPVNLKPILVVNMCSSLHIPPPTLLAPQMFANSHLIVCLSFATSTKTPTGSSSAKNIITVGWTRSLGVWPDLKGARQQSPLRQVEDEEDGEAAAEHDSSWAADSDDEAPFTLADADDRELGGEEIDLRPTFSPIDKQWGAYLWGEEKQQSSNERHAAAAAINDRVHPSQINKTKTNVSTATTTPSQLKTHKTASKAHPASSSAEAATVLSNQQRVARRRAVVAAQRRRQVDAADPKFQSGAQRGHVDDVTCVVQVGDGMVASGGSFAFDSRFRNFRETFAS
jgi:hypothetical protein